MTDALAELSAARVSLWLADLGRVTAHVAHDGTGYGREGFGGTAALILDFIERHRGDSRRRVYERLVARRA